MFCSYCFNYPPRHGARGELNPEKQKCPSEYIVNSYNTFAGAIINRGATLLFYFIYRISAQSRRILLSVRGQASTPLTLLHYRFLSSPHQCQPDQRSKATIPRVGSCASILSGYLYRYTSRRCRTRIINISLPCISKTAR
jgi:hypothetical protein